MRRERPTRRKRSIVENDNPDRWLVSYADFITLLFAFFVVMYAISSINEGKYRVLSDTLVAAFKTPPKSPEPIQTGLPSDKLTTAVVDTDIAKPIRAEPEPSLALDPKRQEQRMGRIAGKVQRDLRPLIDKGLITVTHNQFWVEVEINTSILFTSGSATLEKASFPALIKLADTLKDLPNYIEVEGHTDNLPISTKVYPSNWELSAARAASVVHLFTRHQVSPERLSAIGYGEFRSIADNTTVEGRRKNRRVLVVILADKNAHRKSEFKATSPK